MLPQHPFRSIIFLLFAAVATVTNADSCYSPVGGPLNNTIAYACPTLNPATNSTMCCLASASIGAAGPEVCVPAGATPGDWLCHNKGDNSLWRRGCTDQQWASGGCLRICADQRLDRNNNKMEDWDEPVTQCADGSYCCGSPNEGPGFGDHCCNNGNGVWVMNGTVSKTKPSGYPATSSVASAGNPANAAPTSTSASPATSSGAVGGSAAGQNNVAVIAGVVSGSLAALILLGVGQFFMIRKVLEKKAAKRQRATVGFAELMGIEKTSTQEVAGTPRSAVAQLYGSESAGELPGASHGMAGPAASPAGMTQSGTLGAPGMGCPSVSPMDGSPGGAWAAGGGTWSSGAGTPDVGYGDTRYVASFNPNGSIRR